MPHSKSSKRWLQEKQRDPYVKRAKLEGYRARSVYKLQEIEERYKIIKPAMTVVDLGAAPGSWSKFAAQIVGGKGRVFAVDILPLQPISGVEFLHGDFTDAKVKEKLLQKLGAKNSVDVVLSDLAPNLSGCNIMDQAKSIQLAEAALAFALQTLKPHGTLLLKIFQGEGIADFRQKLQLYFREIRTIKPQASRSRSKEFFLLAKNLKSY